MRKILLAFVVTLGMIAHAAPGTTATTAPPLQESVQVNAVRDPAFKSYQTMLLGVQAFEKHRKLAPKADLKFQLRPLAPDTDLAGVTLRVANDENSVALPVAADGTFVLARVPAVDTKGAELLTNRKKGSIRWRPQVLRPGLPENTHRLGDLRAECMVQWAIGQDELSFVKRNLLAALGACTGKRTIINYSVFKPLAAATLRDGARSRELARPGESMFVPPVQDASWSDDALIELRYMPPKA